MWSINWASLAQKLFAQSRTSRSSLLIMESPLLIIMLTMEHSKQICLCPKKIIRRSLKKTVAERSIRTVSECVRALLLHAALYWKSVIDSSLWPHAVSYTAYTYNHLPNAQGIAQIPRHKLQSFHTWGCPVYVLDPKLQQGQILPRWEPHAHHGIFIGYTSVHSSDVPLVLNIHTGHISPQYHVVFDDSFSTVPSLAADDVPPDFWSAIDFSSNLNMFTEFTLTKNHPSDLIENIHDSF